MSDPITRTQTRRSFVSYHSAMTSLHTPSERSHKHRVGKIAPPVRHRTCVRRLTNIFMLCRHIAAISPCRICVSLSLYHGTSTAPHALLTEKPHRGAHLWAMACTVPD